MQRDARISLGESKDNIAFQTLHRGCAAESVPSPDKRTLVFLSPGFYVGRMQQAGLTDALNRAIRAGVVVNTLDLRGAAPSPLFGTDISERASGSALRRLICSSTSRAQTWLQSDPLMQMANATGGKYFHNSNDFSGGLASLSAPPDVFLSAGIHTAEPEERRQVSHPES